MSLKYALSNPYLEYCPLAEDRLRRGNEHGRYHPR